MPSHNTRSLNIILKDLIKQIEFYENSKNNIHDDCDKLLTNLRTLMEGF